MATTRAIVICILIAATLSHRVSQAFDGQRLPQPIGERDVERYAAVLELSEAQRHAAESLYEEYVDHYELLRTEMIDVAIAHPERAHRSTDEFSKHVPRFVNSVRNLDEDYFAKIQPLLTEEQHVNFMRVRSMRERSLLSRLELVHQFIGDGVPDLAELLEQLALPNDVQATLSPSIDDYHQRIGAALKGIYDAGLRNCVRDEAGAADMLIDRVQNLRSLNRKTFDEWSQHLPKPWQRRWRDLFYSRAYGQRNGFHSVVGSPVNRPSDRASRPD